MINKQFIYYWFFFPLLALLSAGSLTSCIYDSVLEETDMSGKSTLSITMRGITTTDPSTSGGSYDDYVKTLRVIGFDASGSVVCNQLFDYDASTTEIPDFIVQGTGEDTQINITQTMKAGVCDFYFIANEDGYSVYNNSPGDLSTFLSSISSKSELEDCMLATPEDLETLGSSPILMTTSVRSTLKPGDNTINNIELVRCFAKAQLLLKVESEVTKPVSTKVSLCVPAPDSFYLLPGKEEEIMSTTSLSYSVAESEDNSLMNTELKADDYFFISKVVYLPERYLSNLTNTQGNAVKYQITLDKAYEVPIADNTTGNLDYSIKRNYAYTTIGTYAPASEATVTLNWQVKPYDNVNVDVPTFE